jgi:hypothetical protein
MDHLQQYLSLLEQGPPSRDGVFNPWRDTDDRDTSTRRAIARLRLENLQAYVAARRRSARVMLVGEAPSHRGCRFSGIAFCSETELVKKSHLIARHRLHLTSREAESKPQRERSAAVIWDEIERAGCAFEVVLWNAFPWHPYPVESVAANRKPRITEVEHGRAPLRALLGCFIHPLEIFAVGKVAEDAIGRWEEVECKGYIRHPAQGGETRFRESFRRLVAARL